MSIDFIMGEIVFRDEEGISIKVGGFGYFVTLSSFDLKNKILAGKEEKEDQKIFIHSHRGENDPFSAWYGFVTREERGFFRQLILVGGIGPKAASRIMQSEPFYQLLKMIASGDTASLQRIKGLGAKTTEKLVLELRKKAEDFLLSFRGKEASPVVEREDQMEGDLYKEALTALKNLGYREVETKPILASIFLTMKKNGEDLTLEDILRKALQLMG